MRIYVPYNKLNILFCLISKHGMSCPCLSTLSREYKNVYIVISVFQNNSLAGKMGGTMFKAHFCHFNENKTIAKDSIIQLNNKFGGELYYVNCRKYFSPLIMKQQRHPSRSNNMLLEFYKITNI